MGNAVAIYFAAQLLCETSDGKIFFKRWYFLKYRHIYIYITVGTFYTKFSLLDKLIRYLFTRCVPQNFKNFTFILLWTLMLPICHVLLEFTFLFFNGIFHKYLCICIQFTNFQVRSFSGFKQSDTLFL